MEKNNILFKAKRIDNGEWVEGFYVYNDKHYIGELCTEHNVVPAINWHEIDKFTICQYTGLTDKNGQKIWENDIVDFLGHIGKIKYECGCFGIAYSNAIDWEEIADNIFPITGCTNPLNACENDNFISLWEIMWNYNDEEDSIGTVEVIGNSFDTTELSSEKDFKKVINSRSTAYDPDKIIEKLEEIKGLVCYSKSCGECKYASDCLKGEQSEKVAIDEAIEIVKQGGVKKIEKEMER